MARAKNAIGACDRCGNEVILDIFLAEASLRKECLEQFLGCRIEFAELQSNLESSLIRSVSTVHYADRGGEKFGIAPFPRYVKSDLKHGSDGRIDVGRDGQTAMTGVDGSRFQHTACAIGYSG